MLSCFVLLIHFLVKMVPQIAGLCGCWNQFFEPFLAIALWVLWMITLPILTMPDHESADKASEIAPYQGLGTAWLMIWAAAALSTMMVAPAFGGWYQKLVGLMPFLGKLGPAKESNAGMLLGVLLLSSVVMWCVSDICDFRDQEAQGNLDCDDEYAWGLCVALFSMIYCLIMLLCGQCLDSLLNGVIVKWMSVVLAIWWWMGATVITVTQGPDDGNVFTNGTPANGFFGTWLAFTFSAIMAAHHFGLVDLKTG